MLQQLRSHQGLGLQTRPMEGQYPLYGRIQMPPPPGNSRPQQTPVVHPGDMLNNVATAGQSGNMSVSTVRASDGDSGIQDENSNLPLADRTSIHRPHPTPAQPVFPSAELGYRQPVFVLPNQTIYKQQDEQLQQASHMHMHQPAQMLQQLRSHQGLGQQIRPMEGQHPLYGRIQMPPPPGNSRPQQTPVVHPGDMLNNVAALQATTGQLGKMSVSTIRASDADSGIQDEDFDLPLADRIHRPHPTPVSPDGQSHEEVKKELSKPMLSDVADSVKEIHQISTASSASELFEAAPTPSDLTVAEYAANNRPLVRRYNLSTSGFAIVAKIKAANLVHKAVRYMVRACRARKCWGGEFGAKHLMLGRDGSFYLSLEPKVPWTQFYFLDDLDMLMEHLMDHLKEEATGLTAMYFLHLRRICKNPPPSIFSSDLHFEIFLDFVIHHPFFGHPMNRTDLISGAGQWLKYCSDPDIEIIRACLEAAAKNDGWDATHDWRAELDEALLLVLWKGLPPHQRWGPAKLTKSGEDQFIFCRHAIVHFLETTRLAMLVQDLEDPTSENREVVIQFTPTPLETDYMLGLRFDYFIADSIFRILLTLNVNPFIRERWNAFKRSFGGPQELEDEEEEEEEDEEGCSGSGSKA